MGQRGCSNLLRCARHGSLSSLLPNSRANFCCSGLTMASRLSSSSSASSVSSGDSSFLNARGYIEHKVTKLDTLAGVAIKYGVEVADVKRMNGLQTDIQMFGLQTLRIPLPGRHPPSAVLSSDQSSPRSEEVHPSSRLKKHTPIKYGSLANPKAQKPSDKRTVTSAMGLLRGYYGLTSPSTKVTDEGMEMAVYKSDSECHSEDEPFSPPCMPGLSGQGSWLCGDKPVVSDARATDFDNYIASATKQELYAVEPVTTVMPGHHRRPSRDRQESPGLSSSEFPNMPEHHRRPSRERLEVSGNAGDVIDVDRMSERPVRRRPKVEGTASLVDSPSEITEKQDAGGVDRTISPARLPLSTRTSGLRLRETETPPPLPRPPSNGVQTSGEGGFSQGGSGGKVMGSSLLGGNSVENLLSKIRRTASADKFPLFTPSRNRGDSPGPPQVSSQSGSLSGLVKPSSTRRNKAALD